MPERRTLRLTGWVLAVNAIGMLAALALGEPAGDVARGLALLCGFTPA